MYERKTVLFQNELSETAFGSFAGMGPKSPKVCLLTLLLAQFKAWTQKESKSADLVVRG